MLAKAKIEISDLVLKSAGSLEARLADLLSSFNEKEEFKNEDVESFAVHNLNGLSGHNFWVGGALVAQLHLGSLTSGYYVFHKVVYLDGETSDTYEYYNQDGAYVYSAESLDGQCVHYSSINMDPTNPYTNHLYNVLFSQYEAAENGMGDTGRIAYIEKTLNALLFNDRTPIGADGRRKDPALLNIVSEIKRIESDPILNWEERQRVYSTLKQVRKKILRTKSRAHKFAYFNYYAPVVLNDAKLKLELLKKRPADNSLGLLKKYTWGRLVWFGQTVQSNLGLSVAMAIYGPFTFYFITQPMNPHAMWAVGKVRGAYLDMMNALETTTETVDDVVAPKALADEVSTSMAAPQKHETPEPAQSWDDRMSSFKAMQIAYEESMVFAARMGRIEQMENQFLFPLTAEAAWNQMELYLSNLKGALQYNKNLDARYKSFLKREIDRTLELEVYIWKKLARFFNDHPYIALDQNGEQTGKDYYTGRGFVFMKKMTDKLSKMDLSSSPAMHEKINKLAEKYQTLKKDGDSVLGALEKNSQVFAQSDIYNTDELRENMRRHWEVLFLQQNKKQEASSFGLQAYTWSVRNALWILQSVYSSKNQELSTLTYKYNLDNQNTDKVESDKTISALYESMMNMLVLEFVSIKKEIATSLGPDNEAQSRQMVIENLKSYMSERDRLFNGNMKMATGAERNAKRI